MTQKLNIGLIGAGRIGRLHGEHLAYRIPNVNLVAVSDIDFAAAGRLASDFGVPNAYMDHRLILEDPSIDAIVICSSTDTHARLIQESAEAGKHIFCEKPVHLDLVEIDKALEAVEKAGVKLQVGFNRRFDPNFKRARDVVASGQIGVPHIVRITSRDPEPPPISYIQVSGGIFLDQTIHDFDMARFLLGDEVDSVFATGGVLVDPAIGEAGDIDTTMITLWYRNGAIGSIDNSRRAVYGYDQRVEIFGSDGMVIVGNERPNSAIVSDSTGVHGAQPLFFFVERYTESYLAEMHEFVSCVLTDGTSQVSGLDGRIPVVMGYAAKRSFEESRPVQLSEIDT